MTIRDLIQIIINVWNYLIASITNGISNTFNGILDLEIISIFKFFGGLVLFIIFVIGISIYYSFLKDIKKRNKLLFYFLNPGIWLLVLFLMIVGVLTLDEICYNGSYNSTNPINSCW